MVDSICPFESAHYARLLPLAHLRPVYELRCGIDTLREKIERCYPGIPVSLHCRDYMAPLIRARNPGVPVNDFPGKSCLFVNGLTIADREFGSRIPAEGPDTLYVDGDTVIAARVSGARLESLRKVPGRALEISLFEGIPKAAVTAAIARYPWDLVNANGSEIVADATALPAGRRGIQGTVSAGAHLVNLDAVSIGQGSAIKPGAVIDADGGPVVIGRNVTVMPNAVIEGPVFIGDSSTVKIGAKIYGNTSIGPVCKVGGEVEGCIIHSHSNKQHDGFLGHSYLAMWVNLGADTNNSDLKNNYGNVRVVINGEEVDSGSMFVGLMMGDHAKSGINTMFNTGTVVGIASNVFGAGFPPKFVPSFAWGGAEGLTTYDLDRGLEVARRVMQRRSVTMLPEEEELIRRVFELTAEERRSAGLHG